MCPDESTLTQTPIVDVFVTAMALNCSADTNIHQGFLLEHLAKNQEVEFGLKLSALSA